MEVLEFYKKKGVAIVHDKDQDSTDLQKALAHLKKMEVIPNGLVPSPSLLSCFPSHYFLRLTQSISWEASAVA